MSVFWGLPLAYAVSLFYLGMMQKEEPVPYRGLPSLQDRNVSASGIS